MNDNIETLTTIFIIVIMFVLIFVLAIYIGERIDEYEVKTMDNKTYIHCGEVGNVYETYYKCGDRYIYQSNIKYVRRLGEW